MMKQRAANFALLNIDFKDKFSTQRNVVERVTISDKVAGYGGTIGRLLTLLGCIFIFRSGAPI